MNGSSFFPAEMDFICIYGHGFNENDSGIYAE